MKVVQFEEGKRRLVERRRRTLQDRQGAWIGRDPMIGPICVRLIEFNPIIGDEMSDPEQRRQALVEAVERGIVTAAEVKLLDAAILLAKEVHPDD